MKRALVLGAGGFIGNHLVERLKKEDFWIRGVDLKHPEFDETKVDEFIIGDLRNPQVVEKVIQLDNNKNYFDELYQLAADMGGAGYVFIGNNDADIMHNSALINLNVVKYSVKYRVKKLFFSSSACIYPKHIQLDPNNPKLPEYTAYPANPDSEYGWEKLFIERLCQNYYQDFGLETRIARLHNVYGPLGAWQGGREKSPAALCRKIALAKDGGSIEVWGDGKQTRSFTYIDDCLEGIYRLVQSNIRQPLNIGSDQLVSINQLV
ncbi:MAG: NAD-dependent epimerase/dehydratase family protein, partial [Promethearchaeota archaeon]